MSMHLCPETAECCYVGKPSPSACGCHKTDVQVLREQRDELLEALEVALMWAEEERRWASTGDLEQWIPRCEALETAIEKARS